MLGSYLEELGLNSLSPVLTANAGSVGGDDSDDFSLDLSLYTNSTFFDVDFSMGSADTGGGDSVGVKTEDAGGEKIGVLGTGFTESLASLQSLGNLQPLPTFSASDALQHDPSLKALSNTVSATTALPPAPQVASPFSHRSPPSGSAPKAKRQKVSSPKTTPQITADEDKRRRNTAASARFRIKKKQREQQLHDTAREMTDKAQRLEERVKELEMENKWLKGLIVEKKELEGDVDGAEEDAEPLKLE